MYALSNPKLLNKRYFSFSHYVKSRFGEKVGKISIDTNFGCSYKVMSGGCKFCNLESYKAPYIVDDDVSLQWENGKNNYKNRYSKYYAYFQLGTPLSKNVSGMSLDFAKKLVEYDDCIGVMFGARIDMLEESVLKTLNYMALQTGKEIWLEAGIQSSSDETLLYINRGHNYEAFEDMTENIHSNYKNIFVCAHIIFGLPKNDKEIENEDDMIKTIKDVGRLNIAAVKFHQLQVVRDSALEYVYLKNKFPVLDEDYYIDLIVKSISLINPNIIIARLTGDSLNDSLISPKWNKSKVEMINSIDKKLKEENIFQGSNFFEV